MKKELNIGDKIAGFTLISSEAIKEIDGVAYIFEYGESKAKLMWLANRDEDKSFAMAFKTPCADSTGVFHILEHSVLCGSEKYPLKEPFVNLLKTSMQTFLNAVTFPDKTMYPVSSTNVSDLENLMEVYIDALFHTNIYSNPRIFEQEGWHYEVDEDGKLKINGVVYNEMKGALSDPDDFLRTNLQKSLYPDEGYSYEAGGLPEEIPSLTYEKFIDTHARHYNLENSHTILYGDMDIERELSFLNKRFKNVIRRTDKAPNTQNLQNPVIKEHDIVKMNTTPDNACVGVGYVFGTSKDRTKVLAMEILMDAIMGNNEAPMKKAILDAGIGSDVYAGVMDALLQPYLLLELKGSNPDAAEKFKQIITEESRKFIKEGIPKDRLESALSQEKFLLREGDFGFPTGIALSINAMDGWLYSEEDATLYIKYEDSLKELEDGLNKGYFENLLKETILDSNHNAMLELVPVEEDASAAEEGKLQKIMESADASWIEEVKKEAKALKEAQAIEDSPEDVAKLPVLGIKDLKESKKLPKYTQVDAPLNLYYLDEETHNIDYAYFYFNMNCLEFDDLPYAQILAYLLGSLNTDEYSASELDVLLGKNLGSFNSYIEVTPIANNPLHDSKVNMVIGSSALSEKIEVLSTLPQKIYLGTKFSDIDKIHSLLVQNKIACEQNFLSNGHMVAAARATSNFSEPACVKQQIAGIDCYKFLCNLLESWESKKDELIAKLEEIQEKVFTSNNFEVSFAGKNEDLKKFIDLSHGFGLNLNENVKSKVMEVPPLQRQNEGFAIPAGVCYCSESAPGLELDESHKTEFSGSWQIASTILSLVYLWQESRVLGGAYGCKFTCQTDSSLTFATFRDPALDATISTFENAGKWLKTYDCTQADLEGYIVSCVSAIDNPKKPRALLKSLDNLRISGRDATWQLKTRDEIIRTTLDDVHALANSLDAMHDSGSICIVGDATLLKNSKIPLKIEKLF